MPLQRQQLTMQEEAACHFEDTIDKVKAGSLPMRFKEKLVRDLEYVASCGIEDLVYVILFGSAARGELKVTSDLDLLLVTENAVPRSIKADIDTKLDEAVDGVTTDVKFYTHRQFEDSACLFIRQVRKDGRVLWKAKGQ